MTLDEAIAIMEDPTKHTMTCSQGELTSWLRELKEAKRLLKQVCCDFSNDKAVRLDHLNEALQFLKGGDAE